MKISKKNHTKGLFVAVLVACGTSLVVSPALGYWVIASQNDYKGNESISNSDFDTNQFYNVDIYRAFYEVGSITSDTEEITISDQSGWDTFESYLSYYEIQDITRTDDINHAEDGSNSNFTNTYTYSAGEYKSAIQIAEETYLCTIEITTDIVYKYASTRVVIFGPTIKKTYTGAYTITINSASLGEPSAEESYFGVLQVKEGDIITSKMFSTFFESMEEEYYFSNYIYSVKVNAADDADDDDDDQNTGVTLFYLNQTQVTSNLNLYVLFYKEEPSSLGLSALTDAVNNNTGTLTVSNSSATFYDITSDIGYDSESNYVTLGYYDKPTVVQEGSTVNFCLTDGSIYVAEDYDSSTSIFYIDENHSEKVCNYTIKLTGDLEINGELTLGGELGSASNQNVQGNIFVNYVTLDLCGHTINVNNGGSLLSYGVIIDSIGNGEIHVNGGGTIQTPLVLFDYKGGRSTIASFGHDVFPFSNYNIPYLEVPTYIEYDSNGWGKINVFYVISPFSSLVTEIDGEFTIVGSENDDVLLSLSNGVIGQSYVLCSPSPNDKVLTDSLKNSYTSSQAYERHINFYLYNLDTVLDNFTLAFSFSFIGTVDIDMNSQQFDFPISSLFSLYFYNSNFTVSTRICFQKGSSLYMDKDSNLIFSYREISRVHINSASQHTETVTLAGSIFFMDVNVDSYISGQSSMYISDRHNNNNISSIETYFNSNTAFWKYASSSYKIAGSILFTIGNESSYPYSFGGYLDLGSVGLIDEDGEIKSTYTLHNTDSNNYNPFSNLLLDITTNNYDVYFKTYDFDGVNASFYTSSQVAFSADEGSDYMVLFRGRALPLISNGVAYSYSNVYNDETSDYYSPNIVGSYDKELDLIDSDGQLYFFYTGDGDQKPYLGTNSTTNSARNREYNHNCQLKACSYDASNHYAYFTENETTYYYVMFSGLYLPYDTSGQTVNLQRLISKYNTSGNDITLNLSVSYNSTYNRWATS